MKGLTKKQSSSEKNIKGKVLQQEKNELIKTRLKRIVRFLIREIL